MLKSDSEFGIFEYFLHLDKDNNYVKNTNIHEIDEHENTIIIFRTPTKSKDKSLLKILNYKVSFDEFPWIPYLKLNNDLIERGLKTKEDAWFHWKHFGIKEERSYSYINNSNLHQGRFGNIFFINLYLHFMATKYNLHCSYKHEDLFNKLGMFFYKGKNTYSKNCLVTDSNFLTIFHNTTFEPTNLILKDVWFQTKEFCCLLKTYFNNKTIQNRIIKNNSFKNRYNNNNDLFIHLRLGDVSQKTKSIHSYYEELLDTFHHDKRFISSNNVKDPFFKKLVNKYNLIVIDYDEIETIMFASTCKHLILSGGTYSWLIGFFAFYAEYIFYPDIKDGWYGNIFSFSNWIKI
jgi:hypothetical protein